MRGRGVRVRVEAKRIERISPKERKKGATWGESRKATTDQGILINRKQQKQIRTEFNGRLDDSSVVSSRASRTTSPS